jgi:hypothetical protein
MDTSDVTGYLLVREPDKTWLRRAPDLPETCTCVWQAMATGGRRLKGDASDSTRRETPEPTPNTLGRSTYPICRSAYP